LNAKYHEREAQIVSQAGRFKAVTIATNMAGRGTDIVLGGNAEFLARQLAEQKRNPEEGEEEHQKRVQRFLEDFRVQTKQEHERVVELGGLHVLGTERHESRRIDNQLRGRSGRQGDPGSSKFFISLEDDLMRLFGGDRIMGLMDKMGAEEGQLLEHPMISRTIGVAQKRVEGFNFEIRKQLIEYDNVMNKQREAIYGLRRSILESESVKDRILDIIALSADQAVETHLYGGNTEAQWDWKGLILFLKTAFHCDISVRSEQLQSKTYEQAKDMVRDLLLQVYAYKENELGPEAMRNMEKMVFLNIIDSKWKDHLYAMDQLRGSVGLRAYGQRDPILEYKREGFEMFQMMFDSIYQEVAELVFKLRPVSEHIRMKGVFDSVQQNLIHSDFSSLNREQMQAAAQQRMGSSEQEEEAPKPQPVHRSGEKVGRNDPCPCGSGKKYKKCCGK